ncbi:glutamate 5-kinase [Fodinisporobacter ferrooxydans]|uniref:Glutamate 5-kinase n=1 Tax=Fodinisporobacter ferrooxydans TaxID=2901836 RepID=A0ABY4CK83_9BACL|nr:glutamate 5-kinase [Alicyclobacillaceae bacterium MYW30-H2]
MKQQRIVVKVGSSSLTGTNGLISLEKIQGLTAQIAQLQNEGYRVILVSSGAVAAGLGKLGWKRASITMPEKQAASAVGQGLLIDTYAQLFAEHGIVIAQVLLTRSDIEDRKRFLHIRNTLETLLQHGIVPIINENDTVAVEEIRFGDNDTLGSLVALVAEADMLILLTDIDGLYTAHPKKNPDARRISDVWEITEEMERSAGGQGSDVGTGGMRTKLTAAKIATHSGILVKIAASSEPDVLQKIVSGDTIGTTFHPKPDSIGGKKSWMIHGTRVEGTIAIDDGAVEALTEHTGSLLMPGIVAVEGEFHEGAVVEIASAKGEVIGKGVAHFSAWDLKLLLEQKKSGQTLRNLHEVIHRNELVIIKEGNGHVYTG